jgi:tripartite-type tricarboxylate transporter receptor subunit TctC
MNHGRWLAALCTAGALALTSGAQAQDKFPSQPIRLLVGFPAGSSTDVGARILANRLGQVLGQIVVIENRPGASSDIAARAVAAAPTATPCSCSPLPTSSAPARLVRP